MNRVLHIDRAGACVLLTLLIFVGGSTIAQSQTKDPKKIAEATKEAQKAAQVFTEIMNVPDRSIPRDLLDKAEAVAVFPGVIKAGFIVGGRVGDAIKEAVEHLPESRFFGLRSHE